MTLLDAVTILVTGLMVGNELAIAAFIHPAISHIEPSAHLAAAKPIAQVLGRVMPFWYALGLLLLIAELCLRHAQHGVWHLAAAVVLWAGVIVFTIIALAPLNQRIATVDLNQPYPRWSHDRRAWDSRHRVRVAILIVAFILLLASVLGHN